MGWIQQHEMGSSSTEMDPAVQDGCSSTGMDPAAQGWIQQCRDGSSSTGMNSAVQDGFNSTGMDPAAAGWIQQHRGGSSSTGMDPAAQDGSSRTGMDPAATDVPRKEQRESPDSSPLGHGGEGWRRHDSAGELVRQEGSKASSTAVAQDLDATPEGSQGCSIHTHQLQNLGGSILEWFALTTGEFLQRF